MSEMKFTRQDIFTISFEREADQGGKTFRVTNRIRY